VLVVHLVGKGGEPGDHIILATKVVSGRRRHVQAESDAHRPVQAPSQVARILDVPEHSVDDDIHGELLGSHPMDGVRQGSPKRTVPPGMCQRPAHGPVWRRERRIRFDETITSSTVRRGTLA